MCLGMNVLGFSCVCVYTCMGMHVFGYAYVWRFMCISICMCMGMFVSSIECVLDYSPVLLRGQSPLAIIPVRSNGLLAVLYSSITLRDKKTTETTLHDTPLQHMGGFLLQGATPESGVC